MRQKKDKIQPKNSVLFILMILFLFCTGSVQATQNVDYLSGSTEIGLANIGTSTGITSSGDFKDCSSEAYFYIQPVNKSSRSINVSLPRLISVEGTEVSVDFSDYRCKILGSDWNNEDYADANAGGPCSISSNGALVLPANTVMSVRGKLSGMEHTFTRDSASSAGLIGTTFRVVLDSKNKLVSGTLQWEDTLCSSVEVIPASKNNEIEGRYIIDKSGTERCSMNYYFTVRNPDEKFSTVVELPRYIVLNDYRYDIGCSFLYAGCNVSGFRHYAWAYSDESKDLDDLTYNFCDQDQKNGNLCYQETSRETKETLWYITVPPMTKISVRGMVNSLCKNADKPNPMTESYIPAYLMMTDAGSEQHELNGEFVGTKLASSVNSKLAEEPGFSQWADPEDEAEYLQAELIEEPEDIEQEKSTVEVLEADTQIADEQVEKALPPIIDNYYFWGYMESRNITGQQLVIPGTGLPTLGNAKIEARPKGFNYKGVAGLTLEIPAVNVSAEIVEVPLNNNNEWDIQWLKDEVGLLEGSPMPGDGVSIIAAHNHLSKTENGPFWSMFELADGDRLFVRKPDGSLMQFAVYENMLLEPDDFEAIKENSVEGALALITCENESAEGGYLNRRVVFAKPLTD